MRAMPEHPLAPLLEARLVAAVSTGAIALLDAKWVREGGAEVIPARQELEMEPERGALLPAESGAALIGAGRRCVGALSYSWATDLHPDPTGARHSAVRAFLKSERGRHIRGLFWDYASLHQRPRDVLQDAGFERALAAMADCYGSLLATAVLRIDWLPARPAEHDGWVILQRLGGKDATCAQATRLDATSEGAVKGDISRYGKIVQCENYGETWHVRFDTHEQARPCRFPSSASVLLLPLAHPALRSGRAHTHRQHPAPPMPAPAPPARR